MLIDVLDTEITPELVPTGEEEELQSSEAKVGPYALQDFTLFHVLRYGFRPSKIAFLAWHAWHDPDRGDWPPGLPGRASDPATRWPRSGTGWRSSRSASTRSASSSAPRCPTGRRCRPVGRCPRAATGGRHRTCRPGSGSTTCSTVPERVGRRAAGCAPRPSGVTPHDRGRTRCIGWPDDRHPRAGTRPRPEELHDPAPYCAATDPAGPRAVLSLRAAVFVAADRDRRTRTAEYQAQQYPARSTRPSGIPGSSSRSSRIRCAACAGRPPVAAPASHHRHSRRARRPVLRSPGPAGAATARRRRLAIVVGLLVVAGLAAAAVVIGAAAQPVRVPDTGAIAATGHAVGVRAAGRRLLQHHAGPAGARPVAADQRGPGRAVHRSAHEPGRRQDHLLDDRVRHRGARGEVRRRLQRASSRPSSTRRPSPTRRSSPAGSLRPMRRPGAARRSSPAWSSATTRSAARCCADPRGKPRSRPNGPRKTRPARGGFSLCSGRGLRRGIRGIHHRLPSR